MLGPTAKCHDQLTIHELNRVESAQPLDHVFLWQASILLDADEIMNDLTNDLNGK